MDPTKDWRPRILFVSSAWPLGSSFGGQLRALHVARSLQQLGDVTFVIVGSEASNAIAEQATVAQFNIYPAVAPIAAPNRRMVRKLRRLFDSRYLNIHGLVASAADRERVMAYMHDFDLVWVLNSRTANILNIWQWPHAHLDIDDVPSTYFRTIRQNGTGPIERWKAGVQQHLLKRREMQLLKRFTTISVCSDADRRYLGSSERIHVIANGFPRPESAPPRNPSPASPRIGFIGLYSYAPNVDGVQWFLRECWPAIRRAVPGVRLRLVGQDTDGALKPADPDVDALGWVNDPAAEIASWSAMIVPIRFGGGTRIKIAEAFSRKCPAVSTRLGAFGYDVEDGKQLILADRPVEFAAGCIRLLQDSGAGTEMAERAWSDFLEKWTWEVIAARVHGAAADCLSRSGSGWMRANRSPGPQRPEAGGQKSEAGSQRPEARRGEPCS